MHRATLKQSDIQPGTTDAGAFDGPPPMPSPIRCSPKAVGPVYLVLELT